LFLKSTTSRGLLSNVHSIDDHLSEIDSSEIIIIQNLGAQNNHQVLTKESSGAYQDIQSRAR